MIECESCRQGHYVVDDRITNYPCTDSTCACWFCLEQWGDTVLQLFRDGIDCT